MLTLYDPGGPPANFCPHAFNFGATLLCDGDFSQKIIFTPCGENKFLIWGQDLAVSGVSIFKVKTGKQIVKMNPKKYVIFSKKICRPYILGKLIFYF